MTGNTDRGLRPLVPVASSLPLSRRIALGGLLAATAAPVLGVSTASASPESPESAAGSSRRKRTETVYLGAWLEQQLYAADFDPDAGTLSAATAVADVNSSWATRHPTLPVLYVGAGIDAGIVHSYRIDPRTSALRQTSQVAAGGTGTKGIVGHLAIDQPSRTLLVANFAAGTVLTLPIARDGRLGEPVSTVQDVGSGPNPRQAGPHPHCVVVAGSGAYVLVADFGADRVFSYRFDRRTRVLSASSNGPLAYVLPAGSGPRRLVFHPDGRTAYLLTELTASLQTLTFQPQTGRLRQRHTQAIDPPEFTGTPSGAEMALSDDGRFLYVSNRGENILQVYAIDAHTRLPVLIQHLPAGGQVPWGFSFDPSGRWMLVANQASNTINVFAVDRRSGKLTATAVATTVPGPDGIAFVRR